MSEGIVLNFEYIGAHIKDYIKDENFFSTFDMKDIITTMKYANLNSGDFDTLLKQASLTTKANEIYFCTRHANVSIENLQDAISTLESIRKYMKMGILDGIIDTLNHSANEIETLQTELNQIQNEKENIEKELQSLRSQVKQEEVNDLPDEFLSKISELKDLRDFDSICTNF